MNSRRLMRATIDTVALYSLLGWLYTAAIAAFRPDDLSRPVAAFLAIRLDTCGTICFAVGAVALFVRLALFEWRPAAPRPTPLVADDDR